MCGAVRFEISGDFDSFFLCHCEHCRKDTGSARSANPFSATAQIDWIAGSDHVDVFYLPETRHVRAFCSVCGSALPSLQLEGELLVVPAGSLDSDVRIRPTAHIFFSSKASWDADLEQVARFSKLPS